MGEEVAAFVVAADDRSDDNAGLEALVDHCRAQLAPYKVPKQIFLIAELPKSPLGKVQKPELIAQLPPLK